MQRNDSKERWDYRQLAWHQELPGQPLFCVAFNHCTPELRNTLATVSGNRATVYRCGANDSFAIALAFVDKNEEEEYFVCEWTECVSTGSPLLLLAGKNGMLHVVNCRSGMLEASLLGHGAAINDIAVHPHHLDIVATGSKDHTIRVWNVATRDFARHHDLIEASRAWVSKGADQNFPLRHITYPVFSAQVHGARHFVDCVRWMGDLVLSKSVDNKLLAWHPDVEGHDPRGTADGRFTVVQVHKLDRCDGVWWLRFGLDGEAKTLAVGSRVGTTLLYDLEPAEGGMPRLRLRPPPHPVTPNQAIPLVRQSALSSCGTWVASAHEDGLLAVYTREPRPRRPPA